MSENKYPNYAPDTDARSQAPTFDEMVAMIEKLFKDYLKDIRKNVLTDEQIEEGWQRYKTLNHLYQDEPIRDSKWIIGRSSERFKELEHKGWDWRSFYNGWLEGRADMYEQEKGIGQPKPAGAVWVKASRENMRQSAILRDSVLPKNNIHQWRIAGWEAKGVKFTNGIIKEWWELEILDESGAGGNDAIEFAEWVRKNLHDPYGNNWRRRGSYHEISTAELYELFKQQKEK